MNGRVRRATAVAMTVALGVGAMTLSAGTAAAAEPVVIGSCATSVEGAPGTPVLLSTTAVLDPVVNTIAAIPLLGPPLASTVHGVLSAIPNIPIGAIPTGGGYITGGQIANDVIGTLPPLGQALAPVEKLLTDACGVTMQGTNAAAASVENGTKQLAQNSQRLFSPGTGNASPPASPGGGSGDGPGGQPGASGHASTPQGGGGNLPAPNLGMPVVAGLVDGVPYRASLLTELPMAESPAMRYANIPFATPGLFAPSPGVRYGGAVPGYAPQFGVLGTGPSHANNPVRNAGRAQAISAPGAPDSGVGLPILLAVLALAGVTAALVRSWVLRRVAASS